METLLILADCTGHRINSIRMLRWSDLDFQANTIRWRGDQDKIGHEHVTPMGRGGPERPAQGAPQKGDDRRQ